MYNFGSFGKILSSNEYLGVGNEYVFTFAHGRFFEYNSSEWVKGALAERLSSWGDVLTVNRPLFSDHYIIVVKPTFDMDLTTWLQAFDYAWKDMGYSSYSFVSAEVGSISSQPGGFEQLGKQVGETIGGSIGEITKPLLPYILIGGGVYLAILLLPSLMAARGR